MSVRDVEPEADRRNSRDRRDPPVENDQGSQRRTPWGFWLVLAAILVVAVVYSVTMYTIGPKIDNPATAIGAMTAAFAVIGTLVGTYFGIKAGLDGQEKVKETMERTAARDEERRRRDRDRGDY